MPSGGTIEAGASGLGSYIWDVAPSVGDFPRRLCRINSKSPMIMASPLNGTTTPMIIFSPRDRTELVEVGVEVAVIVLPVEVLGAREVVV